MVAGSSPAGPTITWIETPESDRAQAAKPDEHHTYMTTTRRQRAEKTRGQRRRALLLVATVVSILAISAALAIAVINGGLGIHDGGDKLGVWLFGTPEAARAVIEPLADIDESQQASEPEGAEADSADTDTLSAVEVPSVLGKTLAEAQELIEAVGLTAEVVENPYHEPDAIGDARSVIAQDPPEGSLVRAGDKVTLTVGAESGRARTGVKQVDSVAVVVIDPGHQSRGDSTHEPIGPGAAETKPRVTGGTTGVVTRVPEYEVALQISMNLKMRLEAAGVNVIMTRTTNDVNISNAERAKMANEAGADLFVRVHADGSTDSTRCGIQTLYPGENRWTGPIASPSRRAAKLVQESMVAATGAASLGITTRTDLSGFNWSKVPVILVECGFLTNPVEDRLLSSPHYQDKLAEGMTSGILEYLGE